ncbi:periplasmic hemin-binding protein [Vibrio astriarenae]|nr:periplasmic hemin-binding protein [Vibrio sp. C7]
MKKTFLAMAAALLTLSINSYASETPRIISAGSTVTELIYALGAENTLVAVDSTSKHFVEGSDIPQVVITVNYRPRACLRSRLT